MGHTHTIGKKHILTHLTSYLTHNRFRLGSVSSVQNFLRSVHNKIKYIAKNIMMFKALAASALLVVPGFGMKAYFGGDVDMLLTDAQDTIRSGTFDEFKRSLSTDSNSILKRLQTCSSNCAQSVATFLSDTDEASQETLPDNWLEMTDKRKLPEALDFVGDQKRIAVGNWTAAQSAAFRDHDDNRITHVVTTTSQFGCKDLASFRDLEKKNWIYLELEDNLPSRNPAANEKIWANFYHNLVKGVQWIDTVLAENGDNKVLIHCTSGMNRSVAFTQAYLMLTSEHLAQKHVSSERVQFESDRKLGHPYPENDAAAEIRIHTMDAVVGVRDGARPNTAYDVCLNEIAEDVAKHGSSRVATNRCRETALKLLKTHENDHMAESDRLNQTAALMRAARMRSTKRPAYVCIAYGTCFGVMSPVPSPPSDGTCCDKCSAGPFFKSDGDRCRGWRCDSARKRHFICEECVQKCMPLPMRL